MDPVIKRHVVDADDESDVDPCSAGPVVLLSESTRHFAREKYLMKRNNEDVFVLVPKQ